MQTARLFSSCFQSYCHLEIFFLFNFFASPHCSTTAHLHSLVELRCYAIFHLLFSLFSVHAKHKLRLFVCNPMSSFLSWLTECLDHTVLYDWLLWWCPLGYPLFLRLYAYESLDWSTVRNVTPLVYYFGLIMMITERASGIFLTFRVNREVSMLTV